MTEELISFDVDIQLLVENSEKVSIFQVSTESF